MGVGGGEGVFCTLAMDGKGDGRIPKEGEFCWHTQLASGKAKGSRKERNHRELL